MFSKLLIACIALLLSGANAIAQEVSFADLERVYNEVACQVQPKVINTILTCQSLEELMIAEKAKNKSLELPFTPFCEGLNWAQCHRQKQAKNVTLLDIVMQTVGIDYPFPLFW